VKLTVLNDVALQQKDGAEARVAATPDTVANYVKAGHDVTVVKGAGAKADYADALYKDAGASISGTNATAVKSADLVLSITGGTEKLVAAMKKGAGITGVHDRACQNLYHGCRCCRSTSHCDSPSFRRCHDGNRCSSRHERTSCIIRREIHRG